MDRSWGKLTKHNYLTKSADLISSLPSTRKMNKHNFRALLRQYGKVVVKPSAGMGGAGVMQITSMGGDQYKVHAGQYQTVINGLLPTYAYVRRKIKGLHVVQQHIPLAKVKGRPFDVRVMVQRRKGANWSVTGALAKIAGSGYFITNIVRSKGRAVPLDVAIRQSNIKGMSSRLIQKRVSDISLKAVKRLQHHYRIHTVGVDIGIDYRGKVWIIEVNFSPDKTYFLRLKDKTMYRRIMSTFKRR